MLQALRGVHKSEVLNEVLRGEKALKCLPILGIFGGTENVGDDWHEFMACLSDLF